MNYVAELRNDNAPGLNNVPPNDFKKISGTNLLHHFNFILEFWGDRLNYVEWQKCQVIPVPKSWDLSDPNKWRGVNLMDIGEKVFRSMMCKILFKIINLHGLKYQFVSSPGVGCQDGLFALMTALHVQHNHNLPTFVAFVDLVKAFNTVYHGMMIGVLKIYGAPPKLRSAIARMYADLEIVFKIVKVKAEMKQTIGVRQGYCMAPVLFLFMMMVFGEIL